MQEFIAIDFETGNPQRVSACALGYARVIGGKIADSNSYLIRPVGGHAPFQSKIHGIKEEHTFDKPDFGELFPAISEIFNSTLVAHSLFDQQVLSALSNHFGLGLKFKYVDSSAMAKQKLPQLNDHKLKTVAKHFGLPKFQHHDAKEDAIACASICLKLYETPVDADIVVGNDEMYEFKGLVLGVLADDEINYKEAYQLLYWLQDHHQVALKFSQFYVPLQKALEDGALSITESEGLKRVLASIFQDIGKEQRR